MNTPDPNKLEIAEVLSRYDGEDLISIMKDDQGNLYYAHAAEPWHATGPDGMEYSLIPLSEDQKIQLLQNKIPLRDLLVHSPQKWSFVLPYRGAHQPSIRQVNSFNWDCLPMEGVFLNPRENEVVLNSMDPIYPKLPLEKRERLRFKRWLPIPGLLEAVENDGFTLFPTPLHVSQVTDALGRHPRWIRGK